MLHCCCTHFLLQNVVVAAGDFAVVVDAKDARLERGMIVADEEEDMRAAAAAAVVGNKMEEEAGVGIEVGVAHIVNIVAVVGCNDAVGSVHNSWAGEDILAEADEYYIDDAVVAAAEVHALLSPRRDHHYHFLLDHSQSNVVEAGDIPSHPAPRVDQDVVLTMVYAPRRHHHH
jgi:hypothetical protein